jgi:predicted ATP-grasp superfamily ATP-dependent carboligase
LKDKIGMKKKILIAGGSYGDIPLIKKAKELGYHVITSGNNIKELGHTYSDEFQLMDFSDKDGMMELVKSLEIDEIAPSCHDLSMTTCAYIAEKLKIGNFDSYKTTLILHHKDQFRELASELGMLSPKAFNASCIEDVNSKVVGFNFPLIVKPVDLGGGKGVTIVKNKKKLINAAALAFKFSKNSKIIIEEFKRGALHSLSTFIQNQKVLFSFCDSEFSSVNPYGVSTSTSPVDHYLENKKILISQIEILAKKLKLKDGLVHMQYLYDSQNQDISIIELTRRAPGDWYSLPVKLSTGLDYTYWVLMGYLGGDLSNIEWHEQTGYYSRHCLMGKKNGCAMAVIIDTEIEKNIIQKYIWLSDKEVITDYINQKFGIFFLKYSSRREMIEKTTKINKLIEIKVN